jgi:hypothetical protein
MAKAGRITVAEVEEIVPVGSLDPNFIHVPGIFVNRVVLAEKNEKRIERLTVSAGHQSLVTSAFYSLLLAGPHKGLQYQPFGVGQPSMVCVRARARVCVCLCVCVLGSVVDFVLCQSVIYFVCIKSERQMSMVWGDFG